MTSLKMEKEKEKTNEVPLSIKQNEPRRRLMEKCFQHNRLEQNAFF